MDSFSRNMYVSNIYDEYYDYSPDIVKKDDLLKSIDERLGEFKNLTITEPFEITTNQYDTSYSQGDTMYDNRGKYFDLYDFNKNFDSYIQQQEKERLLNEKLKLTDLSTIDSIKIKPYELPIDKMMIGLKDTWFELYDDYTNDTNPLNNFNNDKFFYIGLTFVIVALLYIMLWSVFE
jgi:hypothetical protein